MLWTILSFLASLLFGFFSARALYSLRWAHRLPADLPRPPESAVRCSVILAARDEGERLAATLRHILAQEGVELEVIAVDDRSQDATPAILREIAASDRRLIAKRVDVLPEVWLGKCHACHVGTQSATGDWLLFTDADCWMKPNVIARAIALAEKEGVQHVTLTPGVKPITVSGRACHIAFLLTVLDWIAAVNTDKPNGYLGVGAFNLVRTETYRAFGGHETLRMTVVDDVKLGRLVRRTGGRTRGFIGGDDVECRWGVTAREFVKIMEKNYFAAVDYRTTVAIIVGVIMPLLWAVAVAGPISGTFLGWTPGLALISLAIPAWVVTRRLGWRPLPALVTPFIFPVLYLAILNSMVLTLWRGGVRWRDTFYPLSELRKGNVR